MEVDEKVYYKHLKEFVEEENIFNDIKIVVRFDKEHIDDKYNIIGIKCESDTEDFNLINKIELINDEIEKQEKKYNIFYLLKEMVTYLRGEQRTEKYDNPYSYYRGQSSNWITIPSLLRDIVNENGNEYYEDFEGIYKKISNVFPEEIKYINFNDDEEKRAEQLSRLQHYELKTNLLDITENPFIAMLFMVNSSVFDKPQLELYRINQTHPLFQDGIRLDKNKRIQAQQGAFINFEKLVRYYNEDGEFKISQENKIDRIIISIECDIISTLSNFHFVKQSLENMGKDSVLLVGTEELVIENKEKYEDMISQLTALENMEKNQELETYLYEDIINDIRKKLEEYNYLYDNLFPDFPDYIKNISRKYT